MINSTNHIFIDTNCLINFIGNKYGLLKDNNHNTEALKYLYSLNGKKLYISSLSVAQITAKFQKRLSDNLVKEIQYLLQKFNVIEFGEKDIEKSLKSKNYKDLEDIYQYEMSQKVGCFHILTNNVKDFTGHADIKIFTPKQVRTFVF